MPAGDGVAGEDAGDFTEGSAFTPISEKAFRTGDVCRGTGAGEGEGEVLVGCQRSKTLLLRTLVGFEMRGLGVGLGGVSS